MKIKLRLNGNQIGWSIMMVILSGVVSVVAYTQHWEPLPLWVPIILITIGIILFRRKYQRI